MCGRYTLRTSAAELDEHFGVVLRGLPLRFNIAPPRTVPTILGEAIERLHPLGESCGAHAAADPPGRAWNVSARTWECSPCAWS